MLIKRREYSIATAHGEGWQNEAYQPRPKLDVWNVNRQRRRKRKVREGQAGDGGRERRRKKIGTILIVKFLRV